jgi:DNA-binding transcriptional MerR regulator
MNRARSLTVHEVTERTGLSRKALRLYEERGFVRPDRTDTGYRVSAAMPHCGGWS